MMKILHFKPTMCLEDGGVVKAVLDLCTMAQGRHEVGLATFVSRGVPEEWRRDAPGVTRLFTLKGKPGPAASLTGDHKKQLRTLIEQHDVVHLHGMWSTANPQVAALCKQTGRPYVLSVHGMLDDWCMSQRRFKKLAYLKTWGRNLLRDVAVVHCTAQAELDQGSAWFDPKKGVSVPLPLDLEPYSQLPDPELAYKTFPGLRRDLPKVLFLSRIHYKKGVDRLIKASALLSRRGVGHQLVIAGTGDEAYVRQMKELVASEGVGDHTYFAGFASDAPKIALYSACDLFALPTSQENFGFVFFEALAAGTQVLTTKGTDTWPELQASGGGEIIENSPHAFAEAMEILLADPENLTKMGHAGRRWIFGEMSSSKIARRYEDMYARAYASSRPGDAAHHGSC